MNITTIAIIMFSVLLIGGCIALLVWRGRQKLQSRYNKTASKHKQPLADSNPVSPTKIMFGEPQHPMIEIVRCEAPIPIAFEQLQLADPLKAQIGVLLNYGASLAASTTNITTNTYILRFAPEIAKRLVDGSANIVPSLQGGLRAIAVDGNGKIIGAGTLLPTNTLNAGVSALLIWQILTVVTMQHYLSDIQSRLAKIEAGIADIKLWLESQAIATLLGNFKTMQLLQKILDSQDLSEHDLATIVTQLATIDNNSNQLFTQFRMMMDSEQQAFKGTTLIHLTNAQVPLEHATKHIEKYKRFADVCLMAASIKVTAAKLRSALPVSHRIERELIFQIESDLTDWYSAQSSFYKLVEDDSTKLWA